MSNEFTPGQRWISNTELQLGLGLVNSADFRTVTLRFPASDETRVYAKQTAPLTRVIFAVGDRIRDLGGRTLHVTAVTQLHGLLTYTGQDDEGNPASIIETELDHQLQLNRPVERLFSGQIDADKWFCLRYATQRQRQRLALSELRGLTGVRTSLIPHQLYIAHEVARRYAPRVLLADEVGLGKTIEAGLILHYQLLTERAERVLIVVPETLLHQWLVEMLRRFNLHFSIFDAERCDAMEEALELNPDDVTEAPNPFHSEQWVLCSLDFLRREPARFAQALQGDWDLLVVDEAHHLQWSPHQASTEYQIIEQLAAVTRGVLLLTATPEQLGKESHFARLRLLDPDRFADFARFVAEEQAYQPVAQAIEHLLLREPLSTADRRLLQTTITEGDNQAHLDCLADAGGTESAQDRARQELIAHLLDRHGTGRVLFRNTRSAVQGFPAREVSAYPLPMPDAYAQVLQAIQTTHINDIQLMLCPERLYQENSTASAPGWQSVDPRLSWLSETLIALKPEKILVITAGARTALDMAEYLRTRHGLHAAVFHEGMSIIERDRAAAYFADQETGSPVLICSEIGSEGRNFQFAHHLILFDLPLNPDLLEQRIGRLDRIGQQHTIQIHVPYLDNSAQAILFHWYHAGLNAFRQTCPAGHSVYVQVHDTLMEALHQADEGLIDLPALIQTTQTLHQQLNEQLQRGRDRLLEYNSCRPDIARDLLARAQAEDRDHSPDEFLEQVFDCYGIDMEDHSEHCFILRPGDHMQIDSFPSLQTDGMTVTFDRATALSFEDAHFITWEHPMTVGAMDLVLGNELGNTALIAVKLPGLRPGMLLLECLYVLESASRHHSRYLAPTGLRILLDHKGVERDTVITHAKLNQARISVGEETAEQVVRSQAGELRSLLQRAEEIARRKTPQWVQAARDKGESLLQQEIHRLQALRGVNPNIREEEIVYFQSQLDTLQETLKGIEPRLDALRVIVTT